MNVNRAAARRSLRKHKEEVDHGTGSRSTDVTWREGPFELSGTVFGSIVDRAVQLVDLVSIAVVGAPAYPVGLANAPQPTRTWGTELMARYRRGELIAMLPDGRVMEIIVESANALVSEYERARVGSLRRANVA